MSTTLGYSNYDNNDNDNDNNKKSIHKQSNSNGTLKNRPISGSSSRVKSIMKHIKTVIIGLRFLFKNMQRRIFLSY